MDEASKAGENQKRPLNDDSATEVTASGGGPRFSSRLARQPARHDTLPAVLVYAVVSEQMSDEALELFVDRQMAELMVKNWDRDEARLGRRPPPARP
jgi:hypothetical protein